MEEYGKTTSPDTAVPCAEAAPVAGGAPACDYEPAAVCKRCGAPLCAEQEFCPRCGQKITSPETVPNTSKIRKKLPLIIGIAAAALAILVVLLLVFSGKNAKYKVIDEELQGEWYVSTSLAKATYKFENGHYLKHLVNIFGESDDFGTYKIVDGAILLDDHDKPTFTYTYNEDSGRFRLYYDSTEASRK